MSNHPVINHNYYFDCSLPVVEPPVEDLIDDSSDESDGDHSSDSDFIDDSEQLDDSDSDASNETEIEDEVRPLD